MPVLCMLRGFLQVLSLIFMLDLQISVTFPFSNEMLGKLFLSSYNATAAAFCWEAKRGSLFLLASQVCFCFNGSRRSRLPHGSSLNANIPPSHRYRLCLSNPTRTCPERGRANGGAEA